MEKLRLDKYISTCTGISRSDTRKIILQGLVTVDGTVIKKIDTKVTDTQDVTYNGKKLNYSKYVYIMLNKPKDVVCATQDKNDVTVIDLVKKEYSNRNLFPAGRLDKDSTGFVLLTDDGEFAHNILSPKKHIAKTYIVEVDDVLTEKVVQGFANGVTLADGSLMKSAILNIINEKTAEIIITQGVYHQIKRMLGVFNLGVVNLKRIKIGDVSLDNNLSLGDYRLLTKDELDSITMFG